MSSRRRIDPPSGPRDLGRGARLAPDWREITDGRAKRLGPREHILVTRPTSGPWKDRNPRRTPRWWGLWRWVGLAFWAGLLGEAGRRSWKQHGGVRGQLEED